MLQSHKILVEPTEVHEHKILLIEIASEFGHKLYRCQSYI